MADNVKIRQVPVTIEFKEGANDPYRPGQQVWEMDDRPDIDQIALGTVRVRRYPYTPINQAPFVAPQYDQNGYIVGWSYGSVPLNGYDYGTNLVVSQGALVATTEVRQRYVSETLFLSGEDSFELPYPVLAGLRISILGVWYDIYGKPLWQVGPFGTPLVLPWAVTFDRNSQRLYFGQQVFGQLKYEYWTDYLIYRYTPTYAGDYEFFCTSGTDQYGTIMSFPRGPFDAGARAPEVTVFQVQPPQSLNMEFELYRLTSEAVVNTEGLWEKPEDFPNSGSFAGSEEVLDYTQGYMLIERSHEIGMVLLHDQQTQARGSKSTNYAPLPVDFTNTLKKGLIQQGEPAEITKTVDGFVSTIQTNASRAPKDYAQKVKAIPKANMRTIRYEVKTGKPYEDSVPAKENRYVVRQVTTRYGETVEDVYWENTQKYRIKLKFQPAREPTYDGAFRTGGDQVNDYTYNTQAAHMNAMLRRLWQAIDWKAIVNVVRAAYPESLYEIDFEAANQYIP